MHRGEIPSRLNDVLRSLQGYLAARLLVPERCSTYLVERITDSGAAGRRSINISLLPVHRLPPAFDGEEHMRTYLCSDYGVLVVSIDIGKDTLLP